MRRVLQVLDALVEDGGEAFESAGAGAGQDAALGGEAVLDVVPLAGAEEARRDLRLRRVGQQRGAEFRGDGGDLGEGEQKTLRPAGESDHPVEQRLEILGVGAQQRRDDVDARPAAARLRDRALQSLEGLAQRSRLAEDAVVHGLVQATHDDGELAETETPEQGRHPRAGERGGVGFEGDVLEAAALDLLCQGDELGVPQRRVAGDDQALALFGLEAAQLPQQAIDGLRLVMAPIRGREAVFEGPREDGQSRLIHRASLHPS